MVSERAGRAIHHPSPLVTAHFRCVKDAYDAKTNPDGYINLGTSENHLLWDVVGQAMREAPPLAEADAHYSELHGSRAFREALAQHARAALRAELDPDRIVAVSGASAALDLVAYAAFEPGDRVVVPAPYYSGFDVAMVARSRLDLVAAPLDPKRGFPLEIEPVAKAIEATGDVRGLLLTSPHNPLGRAIPRETLEQFVELAREHALTIVADELYAGSDHTGTDHVSLFSLDDGVHLVYGLAKDLGLAGLKVGMITSHDDDVLAACRELSYLCPVSTQTQATLTEVLSRPDWSQRVLTTNRERLAASYTSVAAAVDDAGIVHLEADAGVFVLLDLRAHLEAPTDEAERALFDRIFNEARVNISPGQYFHAPEPGWFRLCHAQDAATVAEGVRRIASVLD